MGTHRTGEDKKRGGGGQTSEEGEAFKEEGKRGRGRRKGREAFKGGRGRERERGSRVRGERREEGGLKGVEGMQTRMQPAAAFRRSRCLSLPPLLLLLPQQAEAAAAAGCGIRLNRFWVLDHLPCKVLPHCGPLDEHAHSQCHCHSVTLSTSVF